MASISLAGPQESAVFCQFRQKKQVSNNVSVLCGINFTHVLFREPMLGVEGDVDDFPATPQTTASRFPPSEGQP